MKKEYLKPDVEYLDFVMFENIMINPDISVEIGEDDEEGI